VQLLAATNEALADQVSVLEVDEDRYAPGHVIHPWGLKAPPVPEDSGE
jgi:hypothetical protein